MPPSKGNTETVDASALNEQQLGFRMTRQRQVVYDVLLEQMDHPTASELFLRVKEKMPTISLATVYNCLETLSQASLIKQVNLDRGPSRYCPNQKNHAHFFCENCGSVLDIFPRNNSHPSEQWILPRGAKLTHFEIVSKGICPSCSKSINPKKS